MADFMDLCRNWHMSLRTVRAAVLECCLRDVGRGVGEASAGEVCHRSGSPGNRLGGRDLPVRRFTGEGTQEQYLLRSEGSRTGEREKLELGCT